MVFVITPDKFSLVPKKSSDAGREKIKGSKPLIYEVPTKSLDRLARKKSKSRSKSNSNARSEVRSSERCPHPTLDGCVCVECGRQLIELDFRPKYDPKAPRRMASSDPGSTTVTVDGVTKTFETSSNLSKYPKNIITQVSGLYRKVSAANGVVRGNKRKGILAACLMVVLIKNKEFHTEKHITELFGISKKELTEGIKLVSPHTVVDIPQVKDLVKTHARSIGLNDKIEIKKASKFASALEGTHKDFNRSSNSSVAAGLLFLFLELKPSVQPTLGIVFNLKNFSEAVRVSEATLHNIINKARLVYERE